MLILGAGRDAAHVVERVQAFAGRSRLQAAWAG